MMREPAAVIFSIFMPILFIVISTVIIKDNPNIVNSSNLITKDLYTKNYDNFYGYQNFTST